MLAPGFTAWKALKLAISASSDVRMWRSCPIGALCGPWAQSTSSMANTPCAGDGHGGVNSNPYDNEHMPKKVVYDDHDHD